MKRISLLFYIAFGVSAALADDSFVAPTTTIVDSGVVGNTTSLSNGTPLDCTSISVPAGVWDINGVIGFAGNAATTVQAMAVGISTTTGTLPPNSTTGLQLVTFGAANTLFATRNPTLGAGPIRFTFAVTTTVFLVSRLDFSVNTATLSGCQLVAAKRG